MRGALTILQCAAVLAICVCVEGKPRLLVVGIACIVLGLANYVEGARFGQ